MTLKSQSEQNTTAAQQAAELPSGCKTCQRQGLPVFPLRVAAVPKGLAGSSWQPSVPPQPVALSGGEYKYALRTLREGYVYVLLDKKVWQGYQVTAEGYLRQFNPFAMPESETVEPLSQACLTHGHDIAASFINIDDTQYSEAWLAFSSDPWSEQVLEEYASGKRPATRFTQVTLAALKANPAGVPGGLALDSSLSALKANVAEFATANWTDIAPVHNQPAGTAAGKENSVPTGGAHGFYSRQSRAAATGDQVAQLSRQFSCTIAALALNDEVGVVQELNIGRLSVVEARQRWNESPVVRHKHLIADAIQQYLDTLKKATEEQSQPRYTPPVSGYPASGGKTESKEQVAQETYAQRIARLQTYYDEPARTEFSRQYEQTLNAYQEKLNAVGSDLAGWYLSRHWLDAIEYDYAPETSPAGWAFQLGTLTACIQGSTTDPATETVWGNWLKDKNSPAYKGLMGNEKSKLDAVFDGKDGFGNLKTLAGSEEMGKWIGSEGVQQALSMRLVAMGGAMSRLGNNIAQPISDAYRRVVQGVIGMAEKRQVTLFSLDMTLGQFQTLHRGMQQARFSVLANPEAFTGAMAQGGQVSRTVSTGNLFGISDPEILARRVTVTLVSDQAPEALYAELRQSGSSPGAVKRQPLTQISHLDNFSPAELRISSLTLADSPVSTTRLTPVQVQNTLDNQSRMMSRFVSGNGLGLVLSAGLLTLYQVSDLKDNLKAVTEAVSDNSQARLKLLSSMMVTGSLLAECVGFTHLLSIPDPGKLAPNVPGVAEYVHPLLRSAGVIAGIAAVIDGIGMSIKVWSAYQSGDYKAAGWYIPATATTVIGGGYAIYAAWSCRFALTIDGWLLGIGPAGWAALLILTGAMLAIAGDNARSTPFEVWLRRCCFGNRDSNGADKDVVWSVSSNLEVNNQNLNAALAAFNAVVNGMSAEVGYQDKLSGLLNGDDQVKVRISLPGYNPLLSAWSYRLEIAGGRSPLLEESRNTADRPLIVEQRNGLPVCKEDKGVMTITDETWVRSQDNAPVTLTVSYWPDKTSPDAIMTMQITAED
ncbi:T6SS effector BTH_I2691 family protein [Citrobacter freundii]|nr:hypothetical protein [Citrobacter freundii]